MPEQTCPFNPGELGGLEAAKRAQAGLLGMELIQKHSGRQHVSFFLLGKLGQGGGIVLNKVLSIAI